MAAGLLWVGCGLGIDPNLNTDAGLFSCSHGADCGAGYECRAQLRSTRGLCYPIGACKAEVCNGLDDDCNGVADDPFDFADDNDHCGNCQTVCGTGDQCTAGTCLEADCSNGLDDDGDGLTDCADPDRTCTP